MLITVRGSVSLFRNWETEYRQDNLIAGSFQLVSEGIILKGGYQILNFGTVLGKNADGIYLPSIKTANDGSQIPCAILAQTYDTTDGDINGAGIYKAGEFNGNRIIFDNSWTIDELKDALEKKIIFVKTNVVTADDPQ